MLETLALMGHGFVNAMSLSNLLFMAGGTAAHGPQHPYELSGKKRRDDLQGLKGRGDRQGPLSLRAVRSQRRPRRRRDAGGVKGEKPSSLRALSKK